VLPGAIFGGSAILFAADLFSDVRSGHGPAHVFLELGVAASVLAVVALFAHHARAILALADDLKRDLSASRRETGHWQAQARQALDGSGAAIDRNFRKWHLTEAERNVALMLLKGLSHKEIAVQRGTSEGTTRQQALAIYRKAGLTGRSGLAAVVLDGLALAERPPSREA
jgi:DNA-binding CsgD family transcriptional regulator